VRQATITPTGVENKLSPDELIVSKTDLKGVITYANETFARLAVYSQEELLGQPHNIVRHPDMPRAVFRFMWDTLDAEREIFAYVINLASDGSHYWVFAHVTPTYDRHGQVVGYHSSRRAPAPKAVTAVSGLYAQLRRVETEHARPSEGLAASMSMLSSVLAERGMSYDELVWELTP
jgi:PAS domain S-box-containing protein